MEGRLAAGSQQRGIGVGLEQEAAIEKLASPDSKESAGMQGIQYI